MLQIYKKVQRTHKTFWKIRNFKDHPILCSSTVFCKMRSLVLANTWLDQKSLEWICLLYSLTGWVCISLNLHGISSLNLHGISSLVLRGEWCQVKHVPFHLHVTHSVLYVCFPRLLNFEVDISVVDKRLNHGRRRCTVKNFVLFSSYFIRAVTLVAKNRRTPCFPWSDINVRKSFSVFVCFVGSFRIPTKLR